ncbi:suppressor of cytokine signaling 2-like [Urocitellus parryii]
MSLKVLIIRRINARLSLHQLGSFSFFSTPLALCYWGLELGTWNLDLGPTNLRIEYQDGKFRLDSIICVKSKLKQFDSVVHLIDYYVQMCKDKRSGPEAPRNGTVHLYLTKPLYTSAPSLQHLCRLTINKCTGTVWGLPLPTRLKDYLEEYKFQV